MTGGTGTATSCRTDQYPRLARSKLLIVLSSSLILQLGLTAEPWSLRTLEPENLRTLELRT